MHNYNIQDFILKFENIAREQYFKTIDNIIYDNLRKKFSISGTISESGGTNTDRKVRSVDGYFFNESEVQNVSQRILYNETMKLVHRLYETYNNRFEYLPLDRKIVEPPVLHFLEYTAQDKGHYDWHTDDNANFAPRTLTMLIGLNDDYRGGELKVLNDRNPLKLRRNQAVIFPSNFLFSHKVERVTEGKRRVLVVWIK